MRIRVKFTLQILRPLGVFHNSRGSVKLACLLILAASLIHGESALGESALGESALGESALGENRSEPSPAFTISYSELIKELSELHGTLKRDLNPEPKCRFSSVAEPLKPLLAPVPPRIPASASPKVQEMLDDAWRNKHPKTTYLCYHYVKEALYQSGLAPNGSLHGEYAKDAVSDLKKVGFENLLDDPAYAVSLKEFPEKSPTGAIVVYAGDKSYPDGDVQIHDGRGWVSDYYSPNAMIRQWNGSHFHVIGVMIKPQ